MNVHDSQDKMRSAGTVQGDNLDDATTLLGYILEHLRLWQSHRSSSCKTHNQTQPGKTIKDFTICFETIRVINIKALIWNCYCFHLLNGFVETFLLIMMLRIERAEHRCYDSSNNIEVSLTLLSIHLGRAKLLSLQRPHDRLRDSRLYKRLKQPQTFNCWRTMATTSSHETLPWL